MATVFPPGKDPFAFSDSLARNSSDTSRANLDLHVGAFNVANFKSAIPPGATTIHLMFVIFAYPDATNIPASFPQAPIVEILDQNSGSDGPGTPLRQTPNGTASFPVSGSQFVNYGYIPLGGGVFQIIFTSDNVPLDSLNWNVRFTINDGLTSAAVQTGLTFIVDAADARAPWLAVPGQLTLSATGPAPIDFAAALNSVTLAGLADPGSADQLKAGQTYTVLLPVGNYGPGPLTISGVTPTDMTNGFSIRLLTAPLTIAPGGVDKMTLQATFQAPPAGKNGSAATPTAFTLLCNDPLAAGSGATAHFNLVSLFVLVPDPIKALSDQLAQLQARIDAIDAQGKIVDMKVAFGVKSAGGALVFTGPHTPDYVDSPIQTTHTGVTSGDIIYMIAMVHGYNTQGGPGYARGRIVRTSSPGFDVFGVEDTITPASVVTFAGEIVGGGELPGGDVKGGGTLMIAAAANTFGTYDCRVQIKQQQAGHGFGALQLQHMMSLVFRPPSS